MTTHSILSVLRSQSLALASMAFVCGVATRSIAQDTLNQPSADLENRVRSLEGRVKQLETAAADSSRQPTPIKGYSRRSNGYSGVWVNVDGGTGGITKLSISDNAESGSTIQAWGACHPSDCDWGSVKLHRLGDTAAAQELPYGFARWDHGFAEAYLVIRMEKSELVAESYDIFKDDSGRTNYRSVDRFRREVPEKVGSRNVNRSGRQNAVETDTSLKTPTLPPSSASHDVQALVRPIGGAHSYKGDHSLAVYLTFGAVDEGSTLLQIDWTGKVRGALEMPFSISALAADNGRLVATVSSSRVGQGKVISVASDGTASIVFRDKTLLPDTINIWSTTESAEIIVADNGADVLVSVPKDGKTPARKLIQIEGHPDFQSMSVAKCSDGSLLYSGSDFKGVFRVPAGSGPALGKPILPGQAAVAADPKSKIWVAALEDELHVFNGDREIAKLSYPNGLTMFRPNLAFAPDGVLVLGLHGVGHDYLYAVNLNTKSFEGLYSVDSERTTGMTIATTMDWKSNEGKNEPK
jgi:hypothetical protein